MPALEQHGKEAVANLAERASKRINEAKHLSDLGVEDQEGGGLGRRKYNTRTTTSINRAGRKRKVSRKKEKTRTKLDIFG